MMDYGFGFDVDDLYFQWLCEIIHVDQEEDSYWILARELHRLTYYSLIPHDENRAYDGLELRDEYLREINYPKYVRIDGDCTMLEMLIGLARRMDFETSDPYELDDEPCDKTAEWFWELIDNLGLSDFSDCRYKDCDGEEYVECVIDRLLERRYSWDGEGGLFPLERNCGDQRNTEIWYQMNAYLMEKECYAL